MPATPSTRTRPSLTRPKRAPRDYSADSFKSQLLVLTEYPLPCSAPPEARCWHLPGYLTRHRWGTPNAIFVRRLAAYYYGLLPDITLPYNIGHRNNDAGHDLGPACCNPHHLYVRGIEFLSPTERLRLGFRDPREPCTYPLPPSWESTHA